MAETSGFSPQWASPPGDTITDVLHERSVTVSEFAGRIGESADFVQDLLSGRSTITIGLARRLHEVLGASVEFWISRDWKYRDYLHQRLSDDIKRWLSELPVADMSRFGWLSPPPSPQDEALACLRFFDVPDLETWRERYSGLLEAVAFRTSRSIDSKPAAVVAWLRRGLIEAAELSCGPWDPARLRNALGRIRSLTRQKDPQRFLPELQRLCGACGVAVVVLRAPSGCRASGATQVQADGRGLLLLSSRYLTDDQFWFTFFHEIGHLILHGHREVILEGLDQIAEMEEEQANAFAAHVIIPAEHREEYARLRARSEEVLRFSRRVGVSPGLVVGQLQFTGRLRANQLNGLKRRFSWSENRLAIRERP